MSAPLAEHVMLKRGLTKDTEYQQKDWEQFVLAAELGKQMVKDMENQSGGYIIYEECEVREEDSSIPKPALDEEAQQIEEIFKGKRVKEFINFDLETYKDDKKLEFDIYDQCVDLYFT